MGPVDPSTMRELDCRVSGVARVRLLWSKRDGRVAVTVDDPSAGAAFTLEIGEGDSALDAFNHPYAYAARRRIQARPSLPVQLAASEDAMRLNYLACIRWLEKEIDELRAQLASECGCPPESGQLPLEPGPLPDSSQRPLAPAEMAVGRSAPTTGRGSSRPAGIEQVQTAWPGRRHIRSGMTVGGIIVIVGIVLMVASSSWLGLIVVLVGLIAFGGLARGHSS